MKNQGYLLIPFVILFSSILNAQPYYYGSNYIPFKVGHHGIGSIYRVNLSNLSVVETLLTNYGDVGLVLSDESQRWIALDKNFGLEIRDMNNFNHYYKVTSENQGLKYFAYSKGLNKFLCNFFSFSPNIELFVTVDPTTFTISDTIPDMFFKRTKHYIISKDGNYLYLDTYDSLTRIDQIWKYSLSTHQIINKKNYDEIALSGSEKAYLYFRQNGLSVIGSYYSISDPYDYFRIYFLDKDSLSISIKYRGPGKGYISGEGKYLLMFSTKLTLDSLNLNTTGKIEIYNMKIGELEKTIQLPPNGEVMCFENYPNNIYYTIDIEKPTRQVYTLKMDSIFNVIDLTNLTPDTVFVESSSFTLTVKGQGFDTLSVVYFNGQPKTTTFVSDSILTAEIPTTDLISDGNNPVWIKDEWGVSNTLQFTIREKN